MGRSDSEVSVRASALWLRALIQTFAAFGLVVAELITNGLGCGWAALAFMVITACDIVLGYFKYGEPVMREARSAFWRILKQALRFWSV